MKLPSDLQEFLEKQLLPELEKTDPKDSLSGQQWRVEMFPLLLPAIILYYDC